MKLIADGGATSVKWALIGPGSNVMQFATPGVNPAVMSSDEISGAILPGLAAALENIPEPVDSVEYYGAGCLPGDPAGRMRQVLGQITRAGQILVESDMLGACKAALGGATGIVAILGTGSNSCYYDGNTIVANTPAGGFILGDEFSGAWLGKALLSDWLKGMLPEALCAEIASRNFTVADVIRHVYRPTREDAAPNRFLASFTPIYSEHRGNPWIEETLRRGAGLFVARNLMPYKKFFSAEPIPAHFVGSVATAFSDVLMVALEERDFTLGRVLPSALEGLIYSAD